MAVCSTPLGSPTAWSKRSYVHVPGTWYHAGVRVQHLQAGARVYGDGYSGWAGGGLYRVLPSNLESGGLNQRSGPRKPRGLEWVGSGCSARPAPGDHPCGARSVHPVALPVSRTLPADGRLLANKGEINVIFYRT